MSRIAPLVDELVGVESADDIMQEVLGVLSEGSSPETGNIYVFVYKSNLLFLNKIFLEHNSSK